MNFIKSIRLWVRDKSLKDIYLSLRRQVLYKTEKDFLFLDLLSGSSPAKLADKGLYFEFVDQDNFVNGAEYLALDHLIGEGFTARAIRDGCSAIFAKVDHQIAGAAFFSKDRIYMSTFYADLVLGKKEMSYLVYYFVHPDFRSRGIGQELLRLGIQNYISLGFKSMIAAVDPGNTISCGILQKNSFIKNCRIKFIRLFRCYRLYQSCDKKDAADMLGVSLAAGGRTFLKF